MIRFLCPLGHKLAVPDHRAGKKGRCPECDQKVLVPVSHPTPPGEPFPWMTVDPTPDAPLGFDDTVTYEVLLGQHRPSPSPPPNKR